MGESFGLAFFLIVAIALTGSTSWADYVMPKDPMDNQNIEQVINSTLQFASVGHYSGHTSSGDVCDIAISRENPNGALFIAGELTLFSASGANRPAIGSYLIGLNVMPASKNTEGSIQLFVQTDFGEGGSDTIFLTIVGENGKPSLFQYGSVPCPHGGECKFLPGDVVKSLDIKPVFICNGLVRTQ